MTTTPDETRLARVALGCLVEPGDRELGLLVRRVGPVDGLCRVLSGDGVPDRLRDLARLRLRAGTADADVDVAWTLARALLATADRAGARAVTPEDDEWPPQLDDLARISNPNTSLPVDRNTDPPQVLWVRGEIRLDEAAERSVAVVGARAASSYGTHLTTDLAYGLADRGWTVVSGGAYGIDAAAHRAALSAGGLTVAILASGVDRPYPLGHANLFDRIAETGLLVSEWPFGSAPHRVRFLVRNRVIAALTRGTVVVEAASRSGSRQTLGRARRLGRRAMAVPGPVTSATSVGCHAELRTEGTRLVTTFQEILEEVGRIGDDLAPVDRGPHRPHDTLDPVSAQLLDAVLPRRARTAEEIAAVAGLTGRDARRTLPMLVNAGFVEEHGDGYRLRAARRR